jgi:hypothetical protein
MRRRMVVLVVCVAILATLWALSYWPWFVEHVYARGVSFQISRALSKVTGVLPVSLAALLIPGAALYLLVPFVVGIVRVLRGQRRWFDAARAGALRTTTFVAFVLAVFYLTWGLNYARAPLQARLGWPAIERPADEAVARQETDEIAALAAELVDATNDRYRAFAATDDLGRPSAPPDPARAVDASFDDAFARVQRELGLEAAVAAPRGRAKPFPASTTTLSHLGLTGFYFPWMAEANYNASAPAPGLPHTVAHEKAHQRGIAFEDEASFVGYLVCVLSDDPYAQYSGQLFAQRQMLLELAARDQARAVAIAVRRVRGVQRDLDFIRHYWQQFEGVAERVSHAVNDRYLKSQGVRAGVRSYAASQSLLVLFARQRGGVLRIAPGDGRR